MTATPGRRLLATASVSCEGSASMASISLSVVAQTSHIERTSAWELPPQGEAAEVSKPSEMSVLMARACFKATGRRCSSTSCSAPPLGSRSPPGAAATSPPGPAPQNAAASPQRRGFRDKSAGTRAPWRQHFPSFGECSHRVLARREHGAPWCVGYVRPQGKRRSAHPSRLRSPRCPKARPFQCRQLPSQSTRVDTRHRTLLATRC